MTGWINIHEKQPKHFEHVLVLTKKLTNAVCIFVVMEDAKNFLSEFGLTEDVMGKDNSLYHFASQENQGNVLSGVTHWMPLPEPPK